MSQRYEKDMKALHLMISEDIYNFFRDRSTHHGGFAHEIRQALFIAKHVAEDTEFCRLKLSIKTYEKLKEKANHNAENIEGLILSLLEA